MGSLELRRKMNCVSWNGGPGLLASVTTSAAAQQTINERRAAPHAGAVRIHNLLGTIKVDRLGTRLGVDQRDRAGRRRPVLLASGPNTKIGVDAPDSPATPGSGPGWSMCRRQQRVDQGSYVDRPDVQE